MSHPTAITRTKISAPTKWLIDNNKIYGHVLHWGEGKAYVDTQAMLDHVRSQGLYYSVEAYDPYSNDPRVCVFPRYFIPDTIVCNYVLNVLEPKDRMRMIDDMRFTIPKTGIIYVAVRSDKIAGTPHKDGVITKRGTFQKSFKQADLEARGFEVIHNGGHFLIGQMG